MKEEAEEGGAVNRKSWESVTEFIHFLTLMHAQTEVKQGMIILTLL